MFGECHAHVIMDGINYKAENSLEHFTAEDAIIG